MAGRLPEPGELIGEAPAFLEMLEHVSKAAPLARPVLVIGERGTGKELITSRLHYLSERWGRPLVKVNCAALTESLLESELFGHEAGAFTGAMRAHTGRFEQANGGTLVLDELGAIPLRMQENILRVIEYGEFQRVGGSETLTTDVRIVGATNQDLPALVTAGRFRADLLDRLAFDVIHVPPIRERPEDIAKLAYHFAVNITSELRRPLFAGFSSQAEAALLRHNWPGNVRELKNAVERSIYRAEDSAQPIVDILFDPFVVPFAAAVTVPANSDEKPALEAAPAGNETAAVPEVGTDECEVESVPADFRAAVEHFERGILERALERSRFRQTRAAEMLGLTYHQLRGLLKKYALP